ncbi:MAG: lipopolysaccharide heptosyltransferase II [Proteobacteria bacterium]|nr:lipopolysaccharide heptosyltransferase II [Pseudomonadota bacterium]MBU1687750.1 lipopolysaccharide heptosyltransferase II [Pseudomonadota bacterium]
MNLVQLKPRRILIRSTNWIGDAVMTTPVVRTIRRNFPKAFIAILANPWVADVFRSSPHVDEVILFDKKKEHQGLAGLFRLGRQLRALHFDAAILLQNAFEAAFLARISGIPIRAGYSRDGRRLLLTHPVVIKPEVRRRHQVHYYQELCRSLGLEPGPDQLFLQLDPEQESRAAELVAGYCGRPLIGLNPGAAYGPAKCWPVERYGELAAVLALEYNAVMPVFGTEADRATAAIIKGYAPGHVLDLTGRTSLAEAMALIGACQLFITNDSGLMHVAAALDTPLVAIFGSTDPVATGPFAERVRIVRKAMDCQPCFKTHCKSGFRCMNEITVTEVSSAAKDILTGA